MEHGTRTCENDHRHAARDTHRIHRDRNPHLDTPTPTGTTSHRGSQHMERFSITNLGRYPREVLSLAEKPQIMHWCTVDSKTSAGNLEAGTLNLDKQKQATTRHSHRDTTTWTFIENLIKITYLKHKKTLKSSKGCISMNWGHY